MERLPRAAALAAAIATSAVAGLATTGVHAQSGGFTSEPPAGGRPLDRRSGGFSRFGPSDVAPSPVRPPPRVYSRPPHYTRHHEAHFGVYLGAPLYWGGLYYGPSYWWWPRPWAPHPWGYYYDPYPPSAFAVVPPEPPTWIERPDPPDAGGATLPPGYWYWCYEPRGYYPDVRECAGSWYQMLPRPAS